jgi:hypothetical protein
VAAIFGHILSVKLLLKAFQALCNITGGNVVNTIRAGSAGAVEAVVWAMTSYEENGKMVEQACAVLCVLTHGNLDNRNRAENTAGREGGGRTCAEDAL